ncbi:DUF58 domain-containing protein [Simiduia agarivorans]|uniref:Uncharacterized protein n=1 Tax=Simiduia agarivorans (strain DSM 21679 / JCM 13881 / BCRC 17597 / SA1) TaxID=1117647 RepID=K4KGN6_SIMAS|nr:DUF58 domain-containing protein [Simiduia agarivorans]AFU97365.1 hypothetical protein M5M_00650 [Simiduia agarivorans SA1 = DSM 21679]
MKYWLSRWQQAFRRWVNKRIAGATQIQLGQRNLFVFPGKTGLAFIVLLLLLWLLGTNFENTLILLLAFLLTALFVIAILHSYNNLASIKVSFLDAAPVFAGDRAAFRLRFERQPKSLKGLMLQVSWPGGGNAEVSLYDPVEEVVLWFPTTRRGYVQPGRLLIESYYPLGIIRCWTWLDLCCRALVYPAPIETQQAPWASADGELDDHAQADGAEDFIGLKGYQPGMSLNRISWKHLAREQGLQVKAFADPKGQAQALDYDFFAGVDVERRLSYLCYWVLFLDRRGLPYSLNLPGWQAAMGQGDRHRENCLHALARFGEGAGHAD